MAVVWSVVIMAIIVIIIGARVNTDSRRLQKNTRFVQDYAEARGALVDRLDLFQKSFEEILEGQKTSAELSEPFAEEADLSDRCIYHNKIEPQESKININTASYDVIKTLLEVINIADSPQLAAAICAWRGDAQKSEIDDKAFDYYGLGYDCKKSYFESIHELSLVKGFNKIKQVKLNELKKLITIYGDGTININNTTWQVLYVLMENVAQELEIRENFDLLSTAKQFISFRDENEIIMNSLQDFIIIFQRIAGSDYNVIYSQMMEDLMGRLNTTGNIFDISVDIGGCVPATNIDLSMSLLWDKNKKQILRWDY